MPQTYIRPIQIRFREADPARILYFANLPSIAHDTFEDFIQENGFTWKEWFNAQNSWIVPIRHVECDYLAPFMPGEKYEIQVLVAQIRDTSMQMKYVFRSGDKVHAVVKMVHAFLDLKTKQKVPVPEKVRTHLTPYLEAT